MVSSREVGVAEVDEEALVPTREAENRRGSIIVMGG